MAEVRHVLRSGAIAFVIGVLVMVVVQAFTDGWAAIFAGFAGCLAVGLLIGLRG